MHASFFSQSSCTAFARPALARGGDPIGRAEHLGRIGRTALAVLFLGTVAALSCSPAATAFTGLAGLTAPAPSEFAPGSGPGSASESMVLAAAQPTQITSRVTDEAGVLTPAQANEIDAKIKQLQTDKQKLLYVVFTTDTGSSDAKGYAQKVVKARGENTGVFVVNTAARDAGVYVGSEWKQSDIDLLYDAAYGHLADSDWAGAGNAVADAALSGKAGGSGSDSGSGTVWLGAGAGAVALAGGGIWAASKRRSKKQAAATLQDARAIDPADTDGLAQLPTQTLEAMAQEQLVAADESIRRGKEELDIARAEFGPERTRQFTAAMNHSTSTLQKAFAIRQQLYDAIPETEPQQRQMFIDIISSCGQADRALDEKSDEFAKMRDLLINAGSKLDELTQRTVDLRARLPLAQDKLAALHSSYSDEMLHSVADNAQMAQVSIEEAERELAIGRELQAKPAGQQGGLVGAIRNSEHAAEVADRLLAGIEHAEANIAQATDGLQSLIAEVEGEVAEAQQLEQQGKAQGTEADWAALDDVVARSRQAVDAARAHGTSDPLGAYTALSTIDAELDEKLDAVREVTTTHERQLTLFSQQSANAESTIQAAEDLISSRGQLIGATARTALADAKRLYAQALQLQRSDLRGAINVASQAINAAQTALQRAKHDLDDYRRRQQTQQATSVAGNVITGMVLGQILGGGRGGFGGGFGGGGGGFSGGGRGGAF